MREICKKTPIFCVKSVENANFRVKSVKIYTGQKKFTRTVTNIRYVAGKSAAVAEKEAAAAAMKLPEFNAVQKWLDNVVEIKLKERLIQMMTKKQNSSFGH